MLNHVPHEFIAQLRDFEVPHRGALYITTVRDYQDGRHKAQLPLHFTGHRSTVRAAAALNLLTLSLWKLLRRKLAENRCVCDARAFLVTRGFVRSAHHGLLDIAWQTPRHAAWHDAAVVTARSPVHVAS
jgi:hypothetical protein